MVLKQLKIKNRTYYFYDDIINLKDFDPSLLKLDRKLVMDVNIYYIGYSKKNTEYNINSVNMLYLNIKKIDGFIDKKNGNKYLNITLKDNNNDVLIKYAETWNEIKDQIKKINNDSAIE